MSPGPRLLQTEPSSNETSYCVCELTSTTLPDTILPPCSTYTSSPGPISSPACSSYTQSGVCVCGESGRLERTDLDHVVLVAHQSTSLPTFLSQETSVLGAGHVERRVAAVPHTLHAHTQATGHGCLHWQTHAAPLHTVIPAEYTRRHQRRLSDQLLPGSRDVGGQDWLLARGVLKENLGNGDSTHQVGPATSSGWLQSSSPQHTQTALLKRDIGCNRTSHREKNPRH